MRRSTPAAAVLAVLLLAGPACSSGGSGAASTTAAGQTTTKAPATTAEAAPPLTVVVTDDDGIGAPGIDELARAIGALDGVEVHVVAPAENQSGTGDNTTEGGAAHHDAETKSGIEGVAVEGYPADSIQVAIDELGIAPDLVASGINRGQNVGPLTGKSGTVGAALTAVRRGIPAIAGSAGFTENPDYAGAAAKVVEWIVANRKALADHTMPTGVVININVPECTAGKPHKMVDVPVATELPDGIHPFTADCSGEEGPVPPDDVRAIARGFIARSEIHVETVEP